MSLTAKPFCSYFYQNRLIEIVSLSQSGIYTPESTMLTFFTYSNQDYTTSKHVILYGNNPIKSHDGQHQRVIKVGGISQVKYLRLKSNFKQRPLNYQPKIATSRTSTKQNSTNIHHQHALTGVT